MSYNFPQPPLIYHFVLESQFEKIILGYIDEPTGNSCLNCQGQNITFQFYIEMCFRT